MLELLKEKTIPPDHCTWHVLIVVGGKINKKKEKYMNNYQKEVLVGSMLGDGNLRRSNENTLHTYFTFRQSIKNFSYYIFMRDILQNLIRNNDHSYSYDDKR
jgi:hypothetical protein